MTRPYPLPAQRVLQMLEGLTPVSLAAGLALTAMAPFAQAQSLVELYTSARAFDASYQSAKL